MLEVLLVIEIETIGWGGMSWISHHHHHLLLGMIDQGLLVRWEDTRTVEAAAVMDVETHVTEADMEWLLLDPKNFLSFLSDLFHLLI